MDGRYGSNDTKYCSLPVPKFNILIVGDSRLRGISPLIEHELRIRKFFDIHVDLQCFPGADIEATANKCLRIIGHQSYDLIYLFTGVNNLSVQNRFRCISPKYHDIDVTVQDMMKRYMGIKERLETYARKIIMCDSIGLSFGDYNLDHANYPDEQSATDNAVLAINKQIRWLNDKENVTGPWLADYVHKKRHGRIGHRYRGTMKDGIHLNHKSLSKFAKRIVDTFYRNIHATCN